ncbi:MAG: RIP metalloprotease RseP [Candidatus Buchananbacteria bacterium RBG_13_36_9]|uniref:Zinc metalloprotease n=1 Tax=Candidatus Buchananbacteria bacterium RBG_13_36_9 TaxID=1797530 RepID=A0A1G1XQZ3_9BACT|nr:MAG: RIP metalloprotease RseP [Candidatus Buchananbacteria bacterium RBG_13_36_9]
MLITVAIFLIILGLLVFVHEAGHFISARKLGMTVEEFGFGFPPKIWSKKGKDGVIYSVNAIPLGGFCKIKGEDGEDRNATDSFASKKPWRRAIVLSAGVAMNFLLCAVLLSIGYMVGLPQAVDQQALDQGIVKDYKIQVVSLLDDKPAKAAGIEIGDQILSVDEQGIKGVKNIVDYTSTKIGQKLNYTIVRNKEILTKEIEIVDIGQGKGGIGVGLVETGIVSYPIHKAVWHGFELTGVLTREFVFAFGNIIKNLVIGKPVGVQVSGPVGIAVLTGQVAKLGFIYLLQFAALLSLNLAIINFIPFPALDGGRLLFLAIEKIRRKPISQKIENAVHTIGFALLMILIIIITFQDVMRYVDFGKIFNGFFQ